MSRKFHWGWGIGTFYVAFMILVIGFVVYSTTFKDDLVDRNYYDKELKYQEQIDKIARSRKLPLQPKIISYGKVIKIEFPNIFNYNEIKGSVVLYRQSDESLDRTYNLHIDSNLVQWIPATNMAKGLWLIKLDFNYKALSYYFEQNIDIN